MTQISDAKKGILTDEMKHVAEIEGVSEDFILRSVAEGTIVIPSNVNRDIEASGTLTETLRLQVLEQDSEQK